MDGEELWRWAHQVPPQPASPPSAARVLGILVVHNGELWLPRALVALARLTTRPGRLVAVDAGSTDDSSVLLRKALSEGLVDEVISGRADAGFGANVQRGVDASEGFNPVWLWLLHDDLEPARDCLAQLLLATRPEPGTRLDTDLNFDRGSMTRIQAGRCGWDESEGHAARRAEPDARSTVAVLVPKLLHPKLRNHPDQMSALGESITATGARVSSIEPGDIDQQQLDAGPVLGGSTAGMLVSAEAWRALGGFDPGVPLFRDGVEFGWRANLAGFVVRSCPQAACYHREAGRIGLRPSVLAPRAQITDHVAGMRLAAAHAAHPRWAGVRIGANSMLAALGYLVGKSPSQAGDQITALHEFIGSRDLTRQLAKRVSATAGPSVTLPKGLVPGRGWRARRFFDRVAGGVADRYRELASDDAETGASIDELTGSEYELHFTTRHRLLSPLAIGVVVAVLGSLFAARRLFHAGKLAAAHLLPAPSTLGQAWSAWTQSAPTLPGTNSPWLGLAALGSTLTIGHPEWLVALLLLGGVGWASWSAYGYLRRIVGTGWLGVGLAGLWGLLLPVVGALSGGMVDVVVLGIVVPLLARTLWVWCHYPVTGAAGWRAPGAYAFETMLIASMLPALFVPCALIAVLVARRRHDLRGGLVAGLGPVVVLAPWLPRLWHDPGRLLTGPDPTMSIATAAPNFGAALLGRTPEGTTPIWLALIVLIAILGLGVFGVANSKLGRETGHRLALFGFGAVLAIVGAGLTRVVVIVSDTPVRPQSTPWVMVACWLAVVLAGLGFGPPAYGPRVLRAAPPANRSVVDWVARGLLVVALGFGGVWWLSEGTAGCLHRATNQLPSYVVTTQDSSRATRTLMVDLTGEAARYLVVASDFPHWGDAEQNLVSTSPTMRAEVVTVAQQVAQGVPCDDLATRLARLGIAHVWVRGSSTEGVHALAAAPGLSMTVVDSRTMVLVVDQIVSRAMIHASGSASSNPVDAGLVDATVPFGAPGRQIVLAEPADNRWQASLSGRKLPPAEPSDWRQRFAVGEASGTLTLSRASTVAGCLWQGLGFAALVLLMTPAAAGRSVAPKRALSGTSSARRAQGASHA